MSDVLCFILPERSGLVNTLGSQFGINAGMGLRSPEEPSLTQRRKRTRQLKAAAEILRCEHPGGTPPRKTPHRGPGHGDRRRGEDASAPVDQQIARQEATRLAAAVNDADRHLRRVCLNRIPSAPPFKWQPFH